jgi:CDP-glycerol glycerophosphotransferase
VAGPLISVIVPVYNVAGYLAECLDSVLCQASGPCQAAGVSVEVIAVDDASADGSAGILAERAAADPRLRVVRMESNRGQGHARNAGLDLASGDYVWFVDGDDALADGALAAIGARLAGQPGQPLADVLLIDWVSSYPGGRSEPSPGTALLGRVPPGGCTLAERPALLDLTMTAWSKLLRREFLVGLDVGFAAGIHEDVPVTCAAQLAAGSIAAVPQVCYRYRQDRRGSAMATTGAGHLAIFDSYRQAFDLVTSKNAAGAPVSDAVRAALFARAIWHYAAILDAGLVPPAERRRYFARMHAEFVARRPAGYRHPPGARGLKFRLVERGWYPAYAALTPVNRLRVAVARRLRGRAAGPGPG